MRSVRFAVVAGAIAIVAACSSPSTIIQGDTVVVVPEAGTGDPHDSGVSDTGSETDSMASIDATDAADAADGAPSFMCTGASVMGNTSANCRAIGTCMLSTCAAGEAYNCDFSNYPQNLVKCVYSSADSAMHSPAGIHCCEPACVRWTGGDTSCEAMYPGVATISYSCSDRVTPAASCKLGAGANPGAFCCPS